jgi:hypothetical protein
MVACDDAVIISGRHVCQLCHNDQVRREPAPKRETAERNRAVEQDRRDKKLWSKEIDNPRDDE